jgi:hypothetical protein
VCCAVSTRSHTTLYTARTSTSRASITKSMVLWRCGGWMIWLFTSNYSSLRLVSFTYKLLDKFRKYSILLFLLNFGKLWIRVSYAAVVVKSCVLYKIALAFQFSCTMPSRALSPLPDKKLPELSSFFRCLWRFSVDGWAAEGGLAGRRLVPSFCVWMGCVCYRLSPPLSCGGDIGHGKER